MRELAQQRGGQCLSPPSVDARTPLQWACHQKQQWQASASNVRGGTQDGAQRGTWCPTCAVAQRRGRPRPPTLTLDAMRAFAARRGAGAWRPAMSMARPPCSGSVTLGIAGGPCRSRSSGARGVPSVSVKPSVPCRRCARWFAPGAAGGYRRRMSTARPRWCGSARKATKGRPRRMPCSAKAMKSVWCIPLRRSGTGINVGTGISQEGKTKRPGEHHALRADYCSCSTSSLVSPFHPGHPIVGMPP